MLRDNNTILAQRQAAFDTYPGVRVGDYVLFTCGSLERVSAVCLDGWVQTSFSGSWHFGEGGCAFSGSLNGSIKTANLSDTGVKRQGRAWIFDRGIAQAHSAVDVDPTFRIFQCNHVSANGRFLAHRGSLPCPTYA